LIHTSPRVAGNTWLPHHCDATSRAITRSLILASQARFASTISPGPENSLKPPSGIWATVKLGSGRGPKRSEKAVTDRETEFAKSPAVLDCSGGVYTATSIPSDCLAFNCNGPATNDPFGSARLQSNTYSRRPPSAADLAGTGVGD